MIGWRTIGGDAFVVLQVAGREVVAVASDARQLCRERMAAADARAETLLLAALHACIELRATVACGEDGSKLRTAIAAAEADAARAAAERREAEADLVAIEHELDTRIAAGIDAADRARIAALLAPTDSFVRTSP